MKLLDPVPEPIAAKIQAVVPDAEEELIRVCADLDQEGRFGTRWVVVTPDRVLLVPAGGEDGVTEISIDSLAQVSTEALVGGGRLELERKIGSTVWVPYSSSLSVKFSEVARGIEQLRQEEPFQIADQLDRIRCDKCGRLLPEKNGICPACIHRFSTLARIASYMKPHKGRAAVLALASIATALAELLPPLVTKHLVDDVLVPVEGASTDVDQRLILLGLLVLAMVGVRLFSWGTELVHGWNMSWLSARVTADIRAQLYRRLEMLSLQFYDKRQVGSLISRVTRDAEMLQDFLVDGLPYLVINTLMIVGILGFLFSMSWKLTLYILVPIPFILVWSILFWRRMRGIFHKWGRGWGALSTQLNEALHGIRVVKAFAQERREVDSFDKKNVTTHTFIKPCQG